MKRYSAAPAECRIEDFVIKAPMDSEKMFNEITTLNVFRDVPEGNDGGTLATMVYNIYHKYYNNFLTGRRLSQFITIFMAGCFITR